MMKLKLTASTLALLLSSTLAFAADPMAQPSGQAPTGAVPADPNAPSLGGATAQTPPQNWTNLSGTVESVDASAKTIQIKDETGQSFQVPVDREVKIQKDGKMVKLTQLQTGDTITLAKKAATGASGTKTY